MQPENTKKKPFVSSVASNAVLCQEKILFGFLTVAEGFGVCVVEGALARGRAALWTRNGRENGAGCKTRREDIHNSSGNKTHHLAVAVFTNKECAKSYVHIF